MKQSTISCIILAAGTASRMGKIKQLLPLGHSTILEHVIHQALEENFSEIITVVGHKASLIMNKVNIHDARFRWVINDDYTAGQSTSLQAGIRSLRTDAGSFMVFLGDLAFTSQKTIQKVMESGIHQKKKTNETFIVRPTYNNIAGHPVFFGNMNTAFFKEIAGDQGAKALIKKIDRQIYLDLKDKGIVLDIDTPDDYEKAIQSMKRN